MTVYKKKFKYLIRDRNLLFSKKNGSKLYFNIYNDVLFKKFYKYIKNITGYKYRIEIVNFNLIKIILFILDKKSKGYVRLIKYINIFNIKNLYNKLNLIKFSNKH